MNSDNIWNVFDSIKDSYNTEEKKTKEPIQMNNCKYCNSNRLIVQDGAYYCSDCGSLLHKLLNLEPEYRYYGDSDNKLSNPERVGMPTNNLLPKSSLGSLISKSSDNYNFHKMIKYNSWNAMPYKERSRWKVFVFIANKCKKAGIPSCIIEDAKLYYKTISETTISRGSNRSGVIAACVYEACKTSKVPRSSKEIADIFNINLQDMTKGCKRFKETWRLSNQNIFNIQSSNPLDYIERFCSKLNITNDIKWIAEFIAVKAITSSSNLVHDNTAPSIAAGSIYLICSLLNNGITKKLVSQACRISEVTISKCYKKLYLEKKKLLPNKINFP